MRDHRSQLGLEADHTFWEKLGLFLSTLLLGPLIGLLLFLALDALHQPWKLAGVLFCEAVAVFWVSVLIFIWWRPVWFRRVYVNAERRLLMLLRIVLLMIAGLFFASMLGFV